MSDQLSFLEAKVKLEAYCAYQERCHQEIIKKLSTWKIYGDDANALISDLISNNFLNEERFASAFVSGKFRIKKWGRIKIKQALKQKGVSSYSLSKGLAEIDGDAYWETLIDLAMAKNNLIQSTDPWERRIKLQRYLQTKGYEHDLVLDALSHELGSVD